jgi:hypothetical protein
MSAQLTLQLVPGIGARFRSLKECVAAGIYQRGVVAIAGKLDRSPSHLSEALSESERRKFDVDDLERYVERTGDTQPILYLVDKFLRDPQAQQQEALARLATLADQLPALLSAAGLSKGKR